MVYGKLQKDSLTIYFYNEAFKKYQENNQLAESSVVLNSLGTIYFKNKKFKKAAELYQNSIELKEKTGRTEKSDYALTKNNLGLTFWNLKDYEKTIKTFKEVIELREKVKTQKDYDLADSYSFLAAVYDEIDSLENSANYYQTTIKLQEVIYGKEDPTFINSNIKLANIYFRLNKFAEAEKYYLLHASYKFTEQTEYDSTFSILKIADLNKEIGNYEKSGFYYQKLLDLYQKKYSVKHERYAEILNSYGILLQEKSDFKTALEYYLSAHEIFKNNDTTKTNYTANINNLGLIYWKLGNFEKSEYYFIKALNLKRKLYGDKDPTFATAISNLAILYRNKGDFFKAESSFLEALKILKESIGVRNETYCNIISNLGILYDDIGNDVKAEKCYVEAIETCTAVNCGKKNLISYLINIANLYLVKEDYEKANTIYNKILSFFTNDSDKSSIEYPNLLTNIGNLKRRQGDFINSEKYMKEADKIFTKLLGPINLNSALCYHNLGFQYFQTDQFENSVEYFNKSLNIYKDILGDKSNDYNNTALNLALVYKGMKNYKDAEQLYLAILQNNKNYISTNFNWLTESGKEKFWKRENGFYKDLNNFAASTIGDLPSAAVLAYQGNLISKSLLLETSRAMDEEASNSKDPEIRGLYVNVKEKRQFINHLVSSSSGKIEKLERYEEEADSLDKLLTQKLGNIADSKNIFRVQWQDIQAGLKADEAAIEFARSHYNRDSFFHYIALVIRPGYAMPKAVLLGTEHQILQNINDFKELYNLVWEPLDTLMIGVKTVYYSPDGYLNNIAFHALCAEGKSNETEEQLALRGKNGKNNRSYENCIYLSDRYSLQQLSTTRYLAEGLKETKLENSILVFGGVNYDDIPAISNKDTEKKNEDFALAENISRSSANQNRMEYLPGTKLESESLQNILKNKNWKITAFSDAQASENNFKSELKNNVPAILHIATHGFAFPEPEEKKSFGEKEKPYRDADNPMARCGLMLAGSNNSWTGESEKMLSKTGEDGILSALEVSQLNLRKTKLVVLSACETGLGKIEGSEGTFGLKRGFKLAGVEQIIVSLWSVPDKETMELMEKFYSELSVSHNSVEAFEKAQKFMRNKYPEEPLKWAGFVLVR
jgi:CHAT domain-containing protein/Flp pilus assembly protein TadD